MDATNGFSSKLTWTNNNMQMECLQRHNCSIAHNICKFDHQNLVFSFAASTAPGRDVPTQRAAENTAKGFTGL